MSELAIVNQGRLQLVSNNTVEAAICRNVPPEDHDEWMRLKDRYRNAIGEKLLAMELVEQLMRDGLTQRQACAKVAMIKRGIKGISPSMVSKGFILWKNGGQKPNKHGVKSGPVFPPRSWRLFLPSYNNGGRRQPQAFIDFLNRMYADTTRPDIVEAVRARLLDKWREGEQIPGYGTIVDWCAEHGRPLPNGMILRSADIPLGWTAGNISKLLEKSKVKRTIVQRGEYQAHGDWPDQLLRDRSALKPLELITFDDVRFDLLAVAVQGGKSHAVYINGMFCIDVATGMILAYGIKPAIARDEDEGKSKAGTKRSLSMRDTRMLLLQVLEKYGLPPWKIRVLMENATATLSKEDSAAFEGLYGDRLEFELTGMVKERLLKDGFLDEGGMPWQKGWIEALFRLVHTRMNHLPGTTGRRYEYNAGDLSDKVKYTLKTVDAAIARGIAVEELDLPLLTVDEFHSIVDDYVRRLNWRTEHRLQGFDTVYEFEAQPGRYFRSDIPGASKIIPVGAELEPRQEAPIERAVRLMQGVEMEKPHPAALLPFYMDKKPVKISKEKVTIHASHLSKDPLVFRDADAVEFLRQYEGEEVIAWIHSSLAFVHLTTTEYAYIGCVRSVSRVNPLDEEAMGKAMGEVSRGRDRIRNELAELLAPRQAQLANMHQHNEQLLGSRMILEEEKVECQTAKENLLAREATVERQESILESFAASVEYDQESGYEDPLDNF